MAAATIIFPHHLYKNHPGIKTGQRVVLIEETLFFNQYNFHKKKLILHRASMKAYEAYLNEKGIEVLYIEARDVLSDVRELINDLVKKKITCIELISPTDEWLDKRIKKTAAALRIDLKVYDNPGFLNTPGSVATFFDQEKNYFQTTFYIDQRRQRNLLLDRQNGPQGGKWSYDSDNRKKYPKNRRPPFIKPAPLNRFSEQAIEYVEKYFPDNYGSPANFFYPVTHKDAENWLKHFLRYRLKEFGLYEDAIVSTEYVLHHSLLSPLLNTGLLQPQFVISTTLEVAAKYKVPLNSLEGFIRQIIGWREFIRIVYEREGNVQRTRNFWNCKRKIPKRFWSATTGIPPIDHSIRKILDTGYCHHIERLMVLGNFMLLCEFDPDEVYRWFMELFIDSYDWVMVPNVYGLSQFADGGMMTTKPYMSGSNYILKMSNYVKGSWSEIWDGLFWRFLAKHREFFQANNRWSVLIKTLDNMDTVKKDKHFKNAENFLRQLDKPFALPEGNPELF